MRSSHQHHVNPNFIAVRNQLIKKMTVLCDNRLANRKAIDAIGEVSLDYCRDCDVDHEKSWRQFCHTMHHQGVICCARAIKELKSKNIQGLMWHEFGHILSEEELLNFPMFGMDVIYDRNVVHFMMDGVEVDPEIFVDALVDRLFGVRIYYDKRKLQWVELEA